MSDATGERATPPGTTTGAERVCPWYLGYLLVSPLRRLFDNPERLLQAYVRPGITVLEPGCGMGYFSLPLARLVGPGGRVVCVDLQQKMIDGLQRRARRAGLLDRIETVVCAPDDLRVAAWTTGVDLAVALLVVHEVPDAARFLRQIHAALRPGGLFLIVEPKGHVTREQFDATIAAAEAVGFARSQVPPPPRRLAVVLSKINGNR